MIGPSGIKSCIDLMLPFTNRKYPALDIFEIDNATSVEALTITTQQLTIQIQPVYSSEVEEYTMLHMLRYLLFIKCDVCFVFGSNNLGLLESDGSVGDHKL